MGRGSNRAKGNAKPAAPGKSQKRQILLSTPDGLPAKEVLDRGAQAMLIYRPNESWPAYQEQAAKKRMRCFNSTC